MAIHISRFNPEHGRPLSPFAGGTTGRNKVNAIRIQQFSHPRLPLFSLFRSASIHVRIRVSTVRRFRIKQIVDSTKVDENLEKDPRKNPSSYDPKEAHDTKHTPN